MQSELMEATRLGESFTAVASASRLQPFLFGTTVSGFVYFAVSPDEHSL